MTEENIDNSLKSLRKKMGLTQQELAEELGISRQALISLEKGHSLPSFPLIVLLEDFFCQPISEIFEYELGTLQNNEQNNKEDNKYESQSNINNMKGGNMARFSPFEDLNRMHKELDRLFEEGVAQGGLSSSYPTVDVYTQNNQLVVEAEVPGMSEEDLEIKVTDNYLTISGEKREEKEVEEEDYYQKESSVGKFSRQVSLPQAVKSSQAQAKMKEGTLTVTIPLAEEIEDEGAKIEIEKE